MRPLTASAVIAGLLASSVAAGPSPCLKEKIIDPSDRCHSANVSKLKPCLNEILENLTQEALQSCFVKAGCEELDAKFEAQWVIESCAGSTELRKRQKSDDEEDNTDSETAKDEESTTSKKTTSKTTSTKEEEKTTAADEPTTTADSEESKSTVNPQADSTEVIVQTVQASDQASDNAAQPQATGSTTSTTTKGTAVAANTGELTCFTTITYTTQGWDVINTDSTGRVSRSFNSQKVDVKTKCADGMVCREQSCMVADNTLDGSGIAVAIFFGASAAVAFGTLIFLCCRDRRNDKKLRAKAEAAKIAKEAAAAAKPVAAAAATRSASGGRRSPSGNDRQPLMNQGMYPPSPSGSARPSHDPFGDQRRM